MIGRVSAESSEFFKFTVTAGQRLSFEVLGRRLGSALDPWIKLYDAKSGRELPHAYCDDAPGLQTDPRLTCTFPTAGDYLIEVRDSTWRGGADFHYRLRIGDFPCAIAPLPLAIRRGHSARVAFAGPTVDGVAPIDISAPADPALDVLSVVPMGANGLSGWPVTLLVSDFDELLTPEPPPPDGLLLTPPCGVSGRFAQDRRSIRFDSPRAKDKNMSPPFRLRNCFHRPSSCSRFAMPKAPSSARASRTNPSAWNVTASEDGQYTLTAEHLNFAFGPNEVYRITLVTPTPGFDVTLASDQLTIAQGFSGLIPIQSLARRDFGGAIELSVVGPKGLHGSLIVPAGAESGPPPAAGQPAGTPFAMLPDPGGRGSSPRRLRSASPGPVSAARDPAELVSYASTGSLVSQSMGGLPYPPKQWLRTVAVGVLPKPPYSLSARLDPPESVRGLSTTLIVSATRESGFDRPIVISTVGLPTNVTAANQTIASADTEVRMDMKLSDRAALGAYAFTVIGQSQAPEGTTMASVVPPPLTVVRPFELKAEPNPLIIEQGKKAQLTVSAIRKGGYDGPITIELRNLPAQVTASKPAIPKGENSTTVELTASAAAPLGVRGDVDALGTVDLGQQQAASAPFAVRVQAPAPVLTVKAEPASVTLKAGAEAKVKVSVERKNLAGPALISIAGLPAKITASDLTIPADQSSGEVELSAPAAEIEQSKADLTITAKIGATLATTKVVLQIEKLMDR